MQVIEFCKCEAMPKFTPQTYVVICKKCRGIRYITIKSLEK